MKKIIILCHETWGQYLLNDARKQFGLKNVYCVVPLFGSMSSEEYRRQVEQEILNIDSEYLLISDLYSGTTSHIAMSLALQYGVEAICGLSLQTLLYVDKSLDGYDMKGIGKVIEENNIHLCVDLMSQFRETELKEVEVGGKSMPKITFTRVDHRLIHGQVITKWVKIADAKKIIIVDDFLGQDNFMADIYKMAAPSGIDVEILTTQEAGEAFINDKMGDKNIFLLFKNIEMATKAYQCGVKYTKLQLGGVPNEAGKKMIFTAVSLGEQDVQNIQELNSNGVDIILQVVPEEASMSYEDAMKKYHS